MSVITSGDAEFDIAAVVTAAVTAAILLLIYLRGRSPKEEKNSDEP